MTDKEDWLDIRSAEELARMPLRSCDARTIAIAISFKDEQFGANQRRDTMNLSPRSLPGMAKISLIGIATILMLAGIAAGANSSHSALGDPFEGSRVDPFSIMVNAKNLPSQESFNFEDERCLATPIQSMERCHAFHASGD